MSFWCIPWRIHMLSISVLHDISASDRVTVFQGSQRKTSHTGTWEWKGQTLFLLHIQLIFQPYFLVGKGLQIRIGSCLQSQGGFCSDGLVAQTTAVQNAIRGSTFSVRIQSSQRWSGHILRLMYILFTEAANFLEQIMSGQLIFSVLCYLLRSSQCLQSLYCVHFVTASLICWRVL